MRSWSVALIIRFLLSWLGESVCLLTCSLCVTKLNKSKLFYVEYFIIVTWTVSWIWFFFFFPNLLLFWASYEASRPPPTKNPDSWNPGYLRKLFHVIMFKNGWRGHDPLPCCIFASGSILGSHRGKKRMSYDSYLNCSAKSHQLWPTIIQGRRGICCNLCRC